MDNSTLETDHRARPFLDRDSTTNEVTVASAMHGLHEWIAPYQLEADIPELVRDLFQTCCSLFVHGCLRYEFFTLASERSYFVIEAGLGQRFLAAYPNGVPVERGDGVVDHIQAVWFDEVYTALTRTGRFPWGSGNTKWIVRGHPRFNGSFAALMSWARQEGILVGRRNVIIEQAIVRLRNHAAHRHVPHLLMPHDAARDIQETAEIINHLWGHDLPGGRFSAVPPPRMVVALFHQADRRGSLVVDTLDKMRRLDDEHRNRHGDWFLLEVADSGEAFAWTPGHQTTAFPAILIWQGRTWDEAMVMWDGIRGDTAFAGALEWRGRTFLVSVSDQGLNAPMSVDQFSALPVELRNPADTHWRIVRSDFPGDAISALNKELWGSTSAPGVADAADVDPAKYTWEAGMHALATGSPPEP